MLININTCKFLTKLISFYYVFNLDIHREYKEITINIENLINKK